jgi:CRISPR-associated protein Csd2
MDAHLDPTKRHDFVYFFDAKDSNPNGDPDAGNMPRVDPETMQGLVTDVCIKRKIRSWIALKKEYERPYDIFIRLDKALNEKIEESEDGAGLDDDLDPPQEERARRRWMCEQYFDVRTFGAVMSTGSDNSGIGRVTGPMQLTISRTEDPITITDLSITRQAATKKDDFKNKGSTMGRKPAVLYGLYRGHGFYNPTQAEETGFGQKDKDLEDDLDLFWQALAKAFWHDKSALRNQVNMQQVYVFSHEKKLGNAPAHKLFGCIEPRLDKAAMEDDGFDVPRKFAHYTLPDADEIETPDGVEVTPLIDW